MLVEDSALRGAVVELLQDLSWRVRVVASFREAREVVEGERPGVLLVDPGLRVDVLERFVRGLDDRASVPGLVILSDLQNAANVATEHQVVFVREPFDLDELERAVEQARYSDAQPRSSKSSGSR